MCDAIGKALNHPAVPEATRRNFLQLLGTGAAAVAGGVAMAGAAPSAAAAASGSRGGSGRTRLILLGTGGGPALIDGERFGISTAVAYGDRVYVVDLGIGALIRLRQSSVSGPKGSGSTLTNVRGVFFTHMHSDHLMDWPAAYATGMINSIGRTGPQIEVFGPGDRGTLPRVFPPQRPAPPVLNPDGPTPGVSGMTAYLDKAWAADLNDRMRDSNFANPRSLFHMNDIDLAGVWTPDPQGRPPVLEHPIQVWSDGDVRVSATLVDHHPTAPAFAYRFDTPDGSVTISGDTGVSQNLVALAQGTDYLVHEVIDPQWVDRVAAQFPPEVGGALREHLLESHTSIEQVGRDVAEPAGAKNLVLTHLVPADGPIGRWQQAGRGYSGRLIVGRDLMELVV